MSKRKSGPAKRETEALALICRELGWKPRFPELEQTISSPWDWRHRHPEGYGAPAPAAEAG